jgi:hypothetical protein
VSSPAASSAPERATFAGRPVPETVAYLFWDAPERPLELSRHRGLLIRRVLNEGSWQACHWLRENLGDEAIASELRESRGRGVERRALRLWQALLGISASEVDDWLASPERRLWDRRT